MLASATGANSSASRFNIAAATKNSAAEMTVNAQTKPTDNRPDGKARLALRAFRASYSRSATRLKALAVERAETMAAVIQISGRNEGTPAAASTAPRNANGNAKSVCSILIISSVRRVFLITVDTVSQILPQRSTEVSSQRSTTRTRKRTKIQTSFWRSGIT